MYNKADKRLSLNEAVGKISVLLSQVYCPIWCLNQSLLNLSKIYLNCILIRGKRYELHTNTLVTFCHPPPFCILTQLTVWASNSFLQLIVSFWGYLFRRLHNSTMASSTDSTNVVSIYFFFSLSIGLKSTNRNSLYNQREIKVICLYLNISVI